MATSITKNKLYKFRKCTNYSFTDLFNDSVSFVTLSHFNDAMEGYIPFDKEMVYKELIEKDSPRFYNHLIKNEEKKIVFNDEDSFSEKSYEEKLTIVSSPAYKYKALKYIEEFAYSLFNEIRDSFLVSSFCGNGGHPVMWSHYCDDSSGFVEIFDEKLVKDNFHDYVYHEYDNLSESQFKVLGLHNIKYNIKRDCSNLIISFLLHTYHPGESGINRFMKYVKATDDYETIVYILTSKMKEWEYENEKRLILPKFKTTKRKIDKKTYHSLIGDFKSVPIATPTTIIAGENIKTET